MEEKRDLVYEVSKWSQGGPEMLQSWSRRELLQILCAEMGKERKYTGLTKSKMIEHLLRIVSENKSGKNNDVTDSGPQPLPGNTQSSSKRQRKNDHPSRVPIGTNNVPIENGNQSLGNVIHCKNLACRATIRHEDKFCKRCSCCICHKFDDNKDPSLWLVCNSDPPNEGDSCGMSCHLECALKHERAGISENGQYIRLDGGFYCVSCKKVNDLLGCWRKQLMTAKDARRVDVLCYRITLSRVLLTGTKKYQNLHEIVDAAAKKLEAEVGSLDGLPVKMARGIVNRLSSGAEVQKLCTSAVEMLDSMLSSVFQVLPVCKLQDASFISPSIIRFEDVSPISLTVVLSFEDALSKGVAGYTLWYRKAETTDYPAEPACTLIRPNRSFLVSELTPDTKYMFKVVSFGNGGALGKWEVGIMTVSVKVDVTKNSAKAGSVEVPCGSPKTNSSDVSNPSSEGDESNNTAYGDQNNLAGSYSRYKKTEIPDLGKSSDCARKEISHTQRPNIGTIFHRTEATQTTELEEIPGDSVAVLDKEPVTGSIKTGSQKDSTDSSDDNQASDVPKTENKDQFKVQLPEEMSIDIALNAPVRNEMAVVPVERPESALPVTPSKPELGKDGLGCNGRTKLGSGDLENCPTKLEKEPQVGSSSKKRSRGRCEEMCNGGGSLEEDYENCVKMIRKLEREGHVEKNFRVKFLTWYSLHATSQERRIVSVFVDTLKDDLASLAGQLTDTFSDCVLSKRAPPVHTGFCMKLWH
ncbi:VIN3-like protein 2 isoform X2 [Tasmannia lanceolata]